MNSFNELFPGRAHLGRGAGGWLTLQPLNIPIWHRPIRAVRKAFDIVKDLMKGELIHYNGEIFQALDIQLDPKPTTPWEVWLACRGPQMSRLAGRYADGTLSTAPTSYLSFIKEKVYEGAKDVGRKPNEIVIGNALNFALQEDSNASEKIRNYVARIVADTPDLCHEYAKISFRKVAKIRALRKKEGLQAAAKEVTPAMIDAYTLSGTLDNIVKKIQAQIDTGVQHLIFSMPLDPLRDIKILGKEVLPLFK